jgi:soluble cytochrome b562
MAHRPKTMILRIVCSTLLLTLLAAAPALRAQDAPPAAPAPAKPEKTELEKDMDIMGKSMRTLRKQIADSTKNDSSLQLVSAIQTAAEAASKLTPAKTQDLPEADRPQFVQEFQAGMKDLAAALGKLEADLKANDNTAAAADLKQVLAVEGQNHKKFRRPEKEKS